MVLNVRGGNLYLPEQFSLEKAKSIFPEGEKNQIRFFTLYGENDVKIVIGDVQVRFLKLTEGDKISGLVLRFIHLSDHQLDLLNSLGEFFPFVEGDEEAAIPMDELKDLE